MNIKIFLLRLVHGLFALYFIGCLVYLYYSIIYFKPDIFLVLAFVSLGIEGLVVFILNNGDCPLIHIQRIIGDDKPFFELFLPHKFAKRAIPFFSILAILAAILLLIRYFISGL